MAICRADRDSSCSPRSNRVIDRVLNILKFHNIDVNPHEVELDEISDENLAYINQGADVINRVQLNFADIV